MSHRRRGRSKSPNPQGEPPYEDEESLASAIYGKNHSRSSSPHSAAYSSGGSSTDNSRRSSNTSLHEILIVGGGDSEEEEEVERRMREEENRERRKRGAPPRGGSKGLRGTRPIPIDTTASSTSSTTTTSPRSSEVANKTSVGAKEQDYRLFSDTSPLYNRPSSDDGRGRRRHKALVTSTKSTGEQKQQQQAYASSSSSSGSSGSSSEEEEYVDRGSRTFRERRMEQQSKREQRQRQKKYNRKQQQRSRKSGASQPTTPTMADELPTEVTRMVLTVLFERFDRNGTCQTVFVHTHDLVVISPPVSWMVFVCVFLFLLFFPGNANIDIDEFQRLISSCNMRRNKRRRPSKEDVLPLLQALDTDGDGKCWV